jgi:hypothetical protein
MRVAVKKPLIEVEITGKGAELVKEAIEMAYGTIEVSADSAIDITRTAWWKRAEKNSHPGQVLWTYRDNAALTLEQVSVKCGIAVSHLSSMENGKRTIGPKTARKLGKAFGIDHRMFL